MVDAPSAPDLANLFRRIAYALCEAVADHIRRDRNSGPMLEAITISLFSKMRRFEALFTRFRAGAVFPPLRARRHDAPVGEAPVEPAPTQHAGAEPGAARAGRAETGDAQAASAQVPGCTKKVLPKLPRKRGWLTTMMPWVVALYGIRLRAFVEDPASAAFLAACPQARAILRDLWWALCSDPLPETLLPDVAVVPPAATADTGPGPVSRADDAMPDEAPPMRSRPRSRRGRATVYFGQGRRRSFSQG